MERGAQARNSARVAAVACNHWHLFKPPTHTRKSYTRCCKTACPRCPILYFALSDSFSSLSFFSSPPPFFYNITDRLRCNPLVWPAFTHPVFLRITVLLIAIAPPPSFFINIFRFTESKWPDNTHQQSPRLTSTPSKADVTSSWHASAATSPCTLSCRCSNKRFSV